MQETGSTRCMVRSFYAHRLRVKALVIAECNLTAFIGANRIESDILIRIARLLETEEGVLPYGHTVVLIRQLRFQTNLREQIVIECRCAHLVTLWGGSYVFLRCEAFNLQVLTTRRTTVEITLLARESGRIGVVSSCLTVTVSIEPLTTVGNLAAEVPSEVFL